MGRIVNPTQSSRGVSTRQRQVLTAVASLDPYGRNRIEYFIWKAGKDKGFWGGLALHGHLKKLTDRGYLERDGKPGGFCYSLTDKGWEAIF